LFHFVLCTAFPKSYLKSESFGTDLSVQTTTRPQQNHNTTTSPKTLFSSAGLKKTSSPNYKIVFRKPQRKSVKMVMFSPTTFILSALAFASSVSAHMAPQSPAPFRASYNKAAVQNTIDYSITSPLNADGSNFPCKGYQSDMGTAGGASQATWPQGSAQQWTISGGAVHGGGSCQIALSYDKGTSFKVIHSYIGSCPLSSGQAFDFTVPADAPTGDAMFAWTWYNKIGNREIYMDCAAITVTAGSGTASAAFASRPDLFVANLGNGCTTVEGTEVQFPNPGPDVTNAVQGGDNVGTFTGTCAAVKGIGGGSPGVFASTGSSTATATGASSVVASSPPASSPTTMSTVIVSSAVPSSSDSGVFSTSAPGSPAPVSSSSAASIASSASVVAPSATVSATAPVSTGTSGGGSAIAAGTACTTEGEWNCVGGTSFQQCASGAWSIVQPLAAGTQCTAGESSSINITASSKSKRNLVRNFRNVVGQRN
jgi:hypothetical protein